jgi:hypothetical protein
VPAFAMLRKPIFFGLIGKYPEQSTHSGSYTGCLRVRLFLIRAAGGVGGWGMPPSSGLTRRNLRSLASRAVRPPGRDLR